MHRSLVRTVFVAFLLAGFAPDAGAQLPAGWTAVADSGPADRVSFAAMAPGWHLSPGPAAILYQPGRNAPEAFRLDYEAFIFPGDPAGSGVFFGGRGLEPASYDFFEVLLDGEGRYRLGHRAGPDYHEVFPWTAHEAIARPAGEAPGHNRVVLEVGPDRLAVAINGIEVTAFDPPDYARFDGAFGIRVEDGANVHVTRLEVSAP